MTRFRFLLLLVTGLVIAGFGLAGRAAGQTCEVFPADNIWNARVDNLPLDTNSSAYVNTIGPNHTLHPDFGSGVWPPGSDSPIGIPYVTVPGTQPKVQVTFDYNDESDPGPYPIPVNAPIEGGSDSSGDRHILVIDTDNCILYELYNAWPQSDGSWQAGSGAIFPLTSDQLRPAGWTSADAAGLPIYPGLVRYDEVASGEITHALRFTAPQTRDTYVWPARHEASSLTGTKYPPMGQRFRLKASFDISGFSPQVQVILTAMKRYGIILADNGSSWYISGAPDSRWDNDTLSELGQVAGSEFEAVDVSSLMVNVNSGATQSTVQPTGVTVISPDGGETLTSGETFAIEWSAPATATKFRLQYSVNSGKTWQNVVSTLKTGTSYQWKVPMVASNKTGCLVKVTGYNSKGQSAGVAKSARTFTIER
jgi:hypothetical protein